VTWYAAGGVPTNSNIDYHTAMYFNHLDKTINIRQDSKEFNPTSFDLSYPIEVLGGFFDDVEVSWLAELN
jgi:hypothetical protein